MIAALFVAKGGCYFDLEGVDPWDEARDARLYEGPHAVVAHPPCARWCRMAGQVEFKHPERKRGEDGGCFASALASVRKWGGILEHPEHSAAWAKFLLPEPPRRGWVRSLCGGWVARVDQARYGHRAQKPTWLYVSGLVIPPELDWAKGVATLKGTTSRTGAVAMMSHRERSATPLPFRDLLLSIARSVQAQ